MLAAACFACISRGEHSASTGSGHLHEQGGVPLLEARPHRSRGVFVRNRGDVVSHRVGTSEPTEMSLRDGMWWSSESTSSTAHRHTQRGTRAYRPSRAVAPKNACLRSTQIPQRATAPRGDRQELRKCKLCPTAGNCDSRGARLLCSPSSQGSRGIVAWVACSHLGEESIQGDGSATATLLQSLDCIPPAGCTRALHAEPRGVPPDRFQRASWLGPSG